MSSGNYRLAQIVSVHLHPYLEPWVHNNVQDDLIAVVLKHTRECNCAWTRLPICTPFLQIVPVTCA